MLFLFWDFGSKCIIQISKVSNTSHRDIYSTSIDYDLRSDITKKFFATVQNKLHYAVHEHTATELIHERVDNKKHYVGMTNFKSVEFDG